ncbi:MAG: helix-turn-helix domain-containing protein [Nocardioidaceae bacterium]
MTIDSGSGAALLVSPVRRAIVDALSSQDAAGLVASQGGLTAAQLAKRLGLHVTTVRFHLDQLVAAAILEAEFAHGLGVGRPRKVYRSAPGSFQDARGHDSLVVLSRLLAESMEQGDVTPAQAGERWARSHVPAVEDQTPADTPGGFLVKVAKMIDVLTEWGYTPELNTSEGGRTATIDLASCPFLELAQDHPAVVCGIHRGLIAGSMAQLGETDTEVSLEPFVGPRLCQARVRTRTPFTRPHVIQEDNG